VGFTVSASSVRKVLLEAGLQPVARGFLCIRRVRPGRDDRGVAAGGAIRPDGPELLPGFLRGNAAYQEERMRRREALKAREASQARAPDR
jgi:hypothetical protein